MDWKAASLAFITIFVAELGDKTQLSVLGLASGEQSKGSVFFGSVMALALSTAIAVLGAETLNRFIEPKMLQRIAGVLLVVLGALFLLRSR